MLRHTPGTLQVINPSTRDEAQRLTALAIYDAAVVNNPVEVDKLWANTMRSAYANQKFVESFARREDTLDGRLGALKIPTLIIWGREDKITPVALGDRFHREITGSSLLVIEKRGHSANEEQPEQFTAALLNFIKDGDTT